MLFMAVGGSRIQVCVACGACGAAPDSHGLSLHVQEVRDACAAGACCSALLAPSFPRSQHRQ